MPDTTTTDRIEELVTDLSATGIDFARETWIDENNDMGRRDYGVVALAGEPTQIWGDDRLIMQSQKGEVILYLMDGDNRKAHAVQEVLRDQKDMSFTVNGHDFVRDLMAVRWRWKFELLEYLTELDNPPEPDPPEPDPQPQLDDPQPDTEPEDGETDGQADDIGV